MSVKSPDGTAIGSNATLTIEAPPVIVAQPQNQSAGVGSNVTFTVVANGATASLPFLSSGSLQLWLKADAGVVTNGSGYVSQWQDQSGNANNAFQSTASQQPSLVAASGLFGRAVVRFNGIEDNTNGSSPWYGSGLVNIPNAMTAFPQSTTPLRPAPRMSFGAVGVPLQ